MIKTMEIVKTNKLSRKHQQKATTMKKRIKPWQHQDIDNPWLQLLHANIESTLH